MRQLLSAAIFLIIITCTSCGRPEKKALSNGKNTTDTTAKDAPTAENEAMHENRFDVGKIARMTKLEVANYIGDADSEEKVTVQGNIPNCIKAIYLEDKIEVIYINDKADWIKINDDPEMIIVPVPNSYVSVEKFATYIFVKVFTK